MANTETGWTKEFPKVRVRERYWINNGEQLTILQVNPSGRHEVIGSSTKYLESDFHGWEFLGPISPADAEQLVELRRLVREFDALREQLADTERERNAYRGQLVSLNSQMAQAEKERSTSTSD